MSFRKIDLQSDAPYYHQWMLYSSIRLRSFALVPLFFFGGALLTSLLGGLLGLVANCACLGGGPILRHGSNRSDSGNSSQSRSRAVAMSPLRQAISRDLLAP